MLSRIACGLHDLGREVERAQNVIRILEEYWNEGGTIFVAAKAKERDAPVITNSAITVS